MKRINLLLALFFVVASVFMVPSYSAAEKITLVFESYPPYESVEGGKIDGIDVAIIREVCKQLGLEPDFQERPWERAQSEVKSGAADAIFSLFKTDEREKFLFFPSKGLSYEKNIIVGKKGKGVKASSVADLKGKIVGVVKGYSYGDAFDNEVKNLKTDASTNVEMMLKKLDGGRMDVAITNELVYNSMVKKLKLQDKLEVVYVQSNDPLYVGFSKAKGEKGQKLAADFGRVLTEMDKKGLLKKAMANIK
jgi:polar amino acid transport system substrate-binding protein